MRIIYVKVFYSNYANTFASHRSLIRMPFILLRNSMSSYSWTVRQTRKKDTAWRSVAGAVRALGKLCHSINNNLRESDAEGFT